MCCWGDTDGRVDHKDMSCCGPRLETGDTREYVADNARKGNEPVSRPVSGGTHRIFCREVEQAFEDLEMELVGLVEPEEIGK